MSISDQVSEAIAMTLEQKFMTACFVLTACLARSILIAWNISPFLASIVALLFAVFIRTIAEIIDIFIDERNKTL